MLEYGIVCNLTDFEMQPELFDAYVKWIESNNDFNVIQMAKFNKILLKKDSETQVTVYLHADIMSGDAGLCPTVLSLILSSDDEGRVSTKIYMYSNILGNSILEGSSLNPTWAEYEEFNNKATGMDSYTISRLGQVNESCTKTVDGTVYSLAIYHYGNSVGRTYEAKTNSSFWSSTDDGREIGFLYLKPYGYVYYQGLYLLPAVTLKGSLQTNVTDLTNKKWDTVQLEMKIGDAQPVDVKQYFSCFSPSKEGDDEEYPAINVAYTIKNDVQKAKKTAEDKLPESDSVFWQSFESELNNIEIPHNDTVSALPAAWLKDVM